MAKVVIENLSKDYEGNRGSRVRAVDGINLTIEDAEFMVLVGPSGCGKSTTLRMIAGLEEISGGTISIDGRGLNGVPPKDRDIAMVFQNYALYPHMTVRENMAFGLKLRKLPKPDIERRVQEAATILGIEGLLDRRPKALSGGQRQRVAVGRAIVRKPKVFLFDEPLSNLDAKMRVTMRTEISKLHRRLDSTMIYVTHDQVEAMTMGDRICVMKDGHIMQIAAPMELYHNPANLFVAGFIGSPPMNFLRGVLRGEGAQLVFVEERADGGAPLTLLLDDTRSRRGASYEGRTVLLGIRPEAVREANGGDTANVPRSAEVRVEFAEPMGHETHLYLQTGAHGFIARVPSARSYVPGQVVRVAFELEHVHLFDPVTENVLL